MDTSPSQLCSLYSGPVYDRPKCFPSWCLHPHSILLPVMRARGCHYRGGSLCCRPEMLLGAKSHRLDKTPQSPIQQTRSKTHIAFAQASGGDIPMCPFGWNKLMTRMSLIKQSCKETKGSRLHDLHGFAYA